MNAILGILSVTPVAKADAGAVNAVRRNAVAGGGSLITFPTLVALGASPLSANVTNTVRRPVDADRDARALASNLRSIIDIM
jgi:hypothetical protein